MLGRFSYLKVGLATVLVFVGTKMLISGVIKIPILLSLGIIGCILIGSVVASLWIARKRDGDNLGKHGIENILNKESTPIKVKEN